MFKKCVIHILLVVESKYDCWNSTRWHEFGKFCWGWNADASLHLIYVYFHFQSKSVIVIHNDVLLQYWQSFCQMRYKQGVRIHSTPRIHSFSNWGVGVVHSFFGVIYGVGVNPFHFSVHSPLLLFWILEILLENRSTLSHKNFKCQLWLHSWIWQKPMYQYKKAIFGLIF